MNEEQASRLTGIYASHIELAYFAVRYWTVLGLPIYIRSHVTDNYVAVLSFFLTHAIDAVYGTKWYVEFDGVWQSSSMRSEVKVISVIEVRKAPEIVGIIL